MESAKKRSARDTPELLILDLVKRLSHHALWNALSVLLPPLAAVIYCLSYLFLKEWISPVMALVAGVAVLVLGALAILIRYRPQIPSIRAAARLIDDRAGAKDRFLTIATLPSTKSNASMVSRLRAEASGLQSRIAIGREFPYRINRSMYSSLVVSLAVVLLFQLLLPLAHSKLRFPSDHERLIELAARMALRPGLEETARSLRQLAAELEDPKLPQEEKQRLVKEERTKIMEQMKKTTQEQDRNLLGQTAGTLQGLEQQSGGGERKKDQEGGGGIQSNLPQEGKQQGNDGGGGSGANKGDSNAEMSDEIDQGKLAQGNTSQQGEAKNAGGNQNQAEGNRRDRDRPGQDQRKVPTGKTEGGKDERAGRSKASEEIPQGGPPAERFFKPGEGEYEGIKGAGYVTVQLPEALAAEGKGGDNRGDLKRGRALGSQVPVSNVPLPKHLPDAPAEKQQMPLEYRGIIR